MKNNLMNVIIAGALLGAVTPAMAQDKITKGMKSYDAMGCMLLRECTDGIEEVGSILDVSSQYPNTVSYTVVANEFNNMLVSLNRVGVKVFLADEKYFPDGHRGVYHTMSNNFFLNERYMDDPASLMMVMRHEGWHAAQDCMAGSIDNSLIAIIMPEDSVPMLWQEMVKRTYAMQPSAIPWEKEAMWAGKTENMTMNALAACAGGNMWEVYEPTPLTRKYLVDFGYIKE